MRPTVSRPVLLLATVALALAGCAGKKDPSADSSTSGKGLGDFGPSSVVAAPPDGFGDGKAGTDIFGSNAGSATGAGAGTGTGAVFGDGSSIGTADLGAVAGGTGGTGTGQYIDGGVTSGGFIDGGTISQAGTGVYDPTNTLGAGQVYTDGGQTYSDGQVYSDGGQTYANNGLFESTDPAYSNNGGGSANGAGAYNFPGDDGRPTYFSTQVGSRVLFETDSWVLSDNARETLRRQAAWLQLHPEHAITVEGHADERGTREYNLGLGEKRAVASKSYLVSLGLNPARIRTVSYGKERPIAVGSNSRDWSQNRRSETVLRSSAGS